MTLWRKSLTKYNYEIVYKKGKFNVKAFSRTKLDNKSIGPWFEVAKTTIDNFIETSREKLKIAQENDPMIKELREKSINQPRDYKLL